MLCHANPQSGTVSGLQAESSCCRSVQHSTQDKQYAQSPCSTTAARSLGLETNTRSESQQRKLALQGWVQTHGHVCEKQQAKGWDEGVHGDRSAHFRWVVLQVLIPRVSHTVGVMGHHGCPHMFNSSPPLVRAPGP